ncbi:MAG: hypothetical protein A4E52_01203 [Pelotomaculum sp. PtaB.Bin013]|uniref:Uncharacterized protein n=1 Tax=Pelotomaculum isophthalicicum JI TaxID=947010 RepID=A0A9X4H220_9FIRM|nr:hypothetical protein [Pelotomaculum isophthalicicum]MDF9408601.1 hypothetical protein [Pelotomaculum isophthalicicum JI]OPX88627.1 MAG: hypothetical protein A4E52_01203 [Pelotomaculum sp. PtaB.Bin013]
MIPRKKDPDETPDAVISPIEEECDICQEIEGDCCAEIFDSKNDKKTAR